MPLMTIPSSLESNWKASHHSKLSGTNADRTVTDPAADRQPRMNWSVDSSYPIAQLLPLLQQPQCRSSLFAQSQRIRLQRLAQPLGMRVQVLAADRASPCATVHPTSA